MPHCLRSTSAGNSITAHPAKLHSHAAASHPARITTVLSCCHLCFGSSVSAGSPLVQEKNWSLWVYKIYRNQVSPPYSLIALLPVERKRSWCGNAAVSRRELYFPRGAAGAPVGRERITWQPSPWESRREELSSSIRLGACTWVRISVWSLAWKVISAIIRYLEQTPVQHWFGFFCCFVCGSLTDKVRDSWSNKILQDLPSRRISVTLSSPLPLSFTLQTKA